MKKFIQISNNSQGGICVTAGLQNINATNLRSPTADRLSVKPAWSKLSVVIKPGLGWYPSEVKSWATVQSLVKSNVFTIGAETDGDGIPEANLAEATEMKEKINRAMTKYEADTKLAAEQMAAIEKATV